MPMNPGMMAGGMYNPQAMAAMARGNGSGAMAAAGAPGRGRGAFVNPAFLNNVGRGRGM